MQTVVELSSANNNANSNNNSVNQPQQEFQSNAVLQRMKEMEQQFQDMKNTIANLELDNNSKQALIQQLEADKDELSTERRKDMEQILESAVNDWLQSLKGISEEVRTQFKSGITNLAKKADIKNHAWEVICNASQAHKENVAKIDELVKMCNEKEKTIETLLQNNNDPQFVSTISRVSAPTEAIPSVLGKRPAAADDHPSSVAMDRGGEASKIPKNGDAWDTFANMIFQSSRDQYF